jgi:hypothetical protein
MNTQQVIKTFQAALASLVLFGGIASTSIASTPDGETPANEGVCDQLQGGSPGLYGLCVAYCEAQDLDLVGNKPTPNNRILANYRKKMRAGDPDMPCLQVPCPCWSADQLANLGTLAMPTCNVTADTAVVALAQPGGFLQRAVADINDNVCRYTDTSTVPRTSLRFDITADEAQSCYNQVVNKCASLGQ